jgi:death-on-curing family protein
VEFLTEGEALAIHFALVKFFAQDGDPIVPAGVREINLLASALLRPQTSIGDHEKYRTLPQKAGALFHSLVKNHPFHNGNKRTALVGTLSFLDRNGWRLLGEVGDDEIFDFVTRVASNSFPDERARSADEVVDEIASWWRARIASHDPAVSEMSISDFLHACQASGARVVRRGNAYHVQGANGKAIKISTATRKLAGGVVKNYAGVLALAGPAVGMRLDEFQEGQGSALHLVARCMAVLRRLAHV